MTLNYEHLLFYVFAFMALFCCSILTILLIIIRRYIKDQKKTIELEAEKTKKEIEEREKMIMLRFLMIIGIIAIGIAQDEETTVTDSIWEDEDPPIILLPDKPIVFPEVLPKASHEILIDYYGLMGAVNITTFEKDWLDFLNQTNLTA